MEIYSGGSVKRGSSVGTLNPCPRCKEGSCKSGAWLTLLDPHVYVEITECGIVSGLKGV